MNFLTKALADLFKAWRTGSPLIRAFIVVAALLGLAGGLLALFGRLLPIYPVIADRIAAGIGLLAALVAAGISSYQESLERESEERRIERVEARYEANPKETQAAWELARVKLESYVDRNLSQVRSIFWLTTLIMLAGFSLIGFGVYLILTDPASVPPSVLSTAAGVLLNAIGATFLMVYRSTMSQAKDYVTILERINAVGMAVQIVDTLAPDSQLKEQTTSELAKRLLSLYTPNVESVQ